MMNNSVDKKQQQITQKQLRLNEKNFVKCNKQQSNNTNNSK